MSFPDLTLAGIAVVPLIVALVEMAKNLGLPTRWAAPVSVGLGLLASLSLQATGNAPDARAWIDATVAGLALGLSATGLYSTARAQRN